MRCGTVRDQVADSDARAMVFRAEGKVFTGGVDVGRTFADVEGSEEGKRLAQDGIRELQAFEALEIPTLALVHGLCLTAGLEAALACDMIWAAEGAQFGLVERVVGLTPFGGGVQRMAERAGPARAREFVMTGGLYDAEKMLEWGVINRVVAPDDLLEKGWPSPRCSPPGPTVAHAATKRIIRTFLDDGIAAADEATPGIAGPSSTPRTSRAPSRASSATVRARPPTRGDSPHPAAGSQEGAPAVATLPPACPRKRKSRWRARSSSPCPTPCSR